eukprot:s192_g20.t1
MLGVQESRAAEVCSQTDQVLRLGSGSDRGHFGVELWINLTQPIAWSGKKAYFLTKHDVVVVHKDARMLLARISHEVWSAWVLVAHAPQSGQSDQTRADWWEQLHEILQEHVTDSALYVLVDANASPGVTDGVIVGPHDTEPSKSTPYFRQFLQTWSLALPSTFPCHEGDRMTWTSPDGSLTKCIDYVCLPQHALQHCTLSRVVEDLDLGNGMFDHAVVAVQLQWRNALSIACPPKRVQGIDRAQIQYAAVAHALKQYMVPTWNTDIQEHVTHHNEHILHCLRQACPVQARRNEVLRAVFHGWKNRDLEWQHEHAMAFQRYMTALSCWQLHHGVRLHVHATRLKKALKSARGQALSAQLNALDDQTSANDVLQVIKSCIGPTNPKLLKKAVLPHLHKQDGTPCADLQQLVDEWVRFFGEMEGGSRVEWPELAQLW